MLEDRNTPAPSFSSSSLLLLSAELRLGTDTPSSCAFGFFPRGRYSSTYVEHTVNYKKEKKARHVRQREKERRITLQDPGWCGVLIERRCNEYKQKIGLNLNLLTPLIYVVFFVLFFLLFEWDILCFIIAWEKGWNDCFIEIARKKNSPWVDMICTHWPFRKWV